MTETELPESGRREAAVADGSVEGMPLNIRVAYGGPFS
ncbi:hypothetical protein SAMN04488540_12053 [Ferrimonas sediminum]|uniref:Uncharacterized protein n=1 Tax=Ferrimonas sediminum TaxID=718193 RepID=A0A1G8ZM71_9GAMM|nr:hypothetical protein SAMN04488540_12053 [Ferrimonas sediminum]